MENVDLFSNLLRLVELLAGLYLLLIALYTIGWYMLKNPSYDSTAELPAFSVLIAARNEATNIEPLLHDLLQQKYPSDHFEVIIIDDHSDDETASLVKRFIDKQQATHFRLLKADDHGKKAALRQALGQASGTHIAVTDADCRIKPAWLRSIAGYFVKPETKLVLGPVLLHPATNIFERLQQLEFMSLMGSTGGAAALGVPVMGNGANMAFENHAAIEVEKYRNDSRLSSGDDVFLMEAICRYYGRNAVRFMRHPAAVVSTSPQKDFKGFLRQRMRWVSKNRHYHALSIILPALIVFGFNLVLFLLMILTVFYPFLGLVFLLFAGLKLMIDMPLLAATTSFFNKRKLLGLVIPLAFVYPFYVVISGIGGLIFKVRWKGRRI
ncbi:MAG: glycosyltransferase [Bacteroidetes bacterium]|nr:glycosyltransferase [Bacteroidota bacterium]MBU1579161.1 glycosyltransferase [Bacteroidota bacterium]MBU2558673.1 glycosyltransferase [Bacteroidota bacterium]